MSTPRTPEEWQVAAARLRGRKRTARKVKENGKLEENLGPALRWLRLRRGKKQQEVAEHAGITRPMLSAYERGKVKPTLDTLEGLLAALGCDLGQLAGALKIVAAEMPPARGKRPASRPRASHRPSTPSSSHCSPGSTPCARTCSTGAAELRPEVARLPELQTDAAEVA